MIHHNVRFRDARALPDGSAYVDTSDRADWLDQAIDELMNAGYVDIFHWERGGGRWTRRAVADAESAGGVA